MLLVCIIEFTRNLNQKHNTAYVAGQECNASHIVNAKYANKLRYNILK